MTEIITYVTENSAQLIATATAVIAAASAICALTPTPADDKIVGKVYKLIEWVALNFGKAKQK
jgi:hypothetical protein